MIPWLPFEIWSTIFQFITERMNTTQCRVLFLQVTREWREIASATSQLWTDLYIRSVDPSQAEFFLSHSGERPVDVHIELLNLSATRKPNIERLTETLSNHVNRIRSLDIDVEEHKYADMLVAQIGKGQHAPSLESFCVKIEAKEQNYGPLPGFVSLQSAFQSTPNMTHLSLPAFPLPNSSSPIFSTLSITHLTLDAIPFYWNIDNDMVFDVLHAVCRKLQSFIFKGSDNFSFHLASTLPQVTMPRLTSVNVSAPGWGLDILDTFRAPILSDVRLDALRQKYYSAPEDWAREFGRYATRSLRALSDRSPLIKRLELAGIALTEPETNYVWLFDNAFPMLEELRFEDTDISDDLLARATVGGLPRLRVLEVSNCAAVCGPGVFAFLRSQRRRSDAN